MHCILAILLNTGLLSTERNRLVITSISSETPYYGIFLPHVETFFPTPKQYSHIYMTGNKFDGQGTYLRAYCSDKLNENMIIQDIIVGMFNLANDKEILLPRVTADLAFCYTAINKLMLESKGSRINLSQIVGCKECSKNAIVSLAFWKHTSFYGTYSNIFPKAEVEGRHINADVALQVNDLVHDGAFYFGTTTPPGKQFLAWYQGNLHVFLRTKENDWYILTDTITRPENGILISKLAWFTNGPFLPLHQLLAARSSESGRESRRRRCYKAMTCKFESPKSRLRRQMADIKLVKLETLHAQGNVGSSPRPDFINSWMREIIPPRVQYHDGSSPRSKNTDLWMREIHPSPQLSPQLSPQS